MTIIEEKATKNFFESMEFRNKLLEDLGLRRVQYKDLPLKLKFRRSILMKADIREVLIYAPLSAYRNSYCVEGMCRNLLHIEQTFYSINEYKMLIDNMRKAEAEPHVWAKAVLFFMKSRHSDIILGYLFNGNLLVM